MIGSFEGRRENVAYLIRSLQDLRDVAIQERRCYESSDGDAWSGESETYDRLHAVIACLDGAIRRLAPIHDALDVARLRELSCRAP